MSGPSSMKGRMNNKDNVKYLTRDSKKIGVIVNLGNEPIRLGKIIVGLEGDEEIALSSIVVACDFHNNVMFVLRVIDQLYYSPLAHPTDIRIRREVLGEEVTAPAEIMSHIGAIRALKTELVDVIKYENGNLELIGPRCVPPPGTPVYTASKVILSALLGRQEVPIKVGTLLGADADVTIDLQKLNRHMLIVGTTGTGKSWLRGVLLEKIYDLGVPQVVFDPLRDYVKATEQLGGINLRYGKKFLPPLSELTPGLFGLLLEGVLTPLQLSLAVRAFDMYRRKVLNGKIKEDPWAIIDLIEYVAREMSVKEETKRNTIARVETLLRQLGYSERRRGLLSYANTASENDDVQIVDAPAMERIIREKRLVNIDLHGVSDLELQVTISTILNQLLRLREQNRIDPLIISFDEAHRIAPRVRPNQKVPPSVYVVRNLIRYGRHYGIGVIAITQFPSSVDIELIRLPATRFIFAVDSDQLGAISGLISDLPEEIRNNLPKLERGTAFLAGTADIVRHTVYVRIESERRTEHGGKAPKFRPNKNREV